MNYVWISIKTPHLWIFFLMGKLYHMIVLHCQAPYKLNKLILLKDNDNLDKRWDWCKGVGKLVKNMLYFFIPLST